MRITKNMRLRLKTVLKITRIKMKPRARRWFSVIAIIATLLQSSCSILVPEGMADTLLKVTYNGNTNSTGTVPVDSKSYVKGMQATILGNTGNLAKGVIVFGRWNTQPNGSGKDYAPGDVITLESKDIVLYARWSPVRTLTYSGNTQTGGTVPLDGKLYINGATATVLANSGNLTKTGGFFHIGWNTAANGTGTRYLPGATFVMPDANTTLYAQWSASGYSITYDGNGGTGTPPPVSFYLAGDNATVLGAGSLTRVGFALTGWNTNAAGTGTAYAIGATLPMGAANITLYAVWTPAYSVTYNACSGTGSVPSDSTNYVAGTNVTVLGNTGPLTRTGYTFSGWTNAGCGTGTNYLAGNTFSMPASNQNLYANWQLTAYQVTYNGNGHTGGTPPVDANNYNMGNPVTVLSQGTLVRTAYRFMRWNTLANGTGTNYNPAATFNIDTMNPANVTLYAQWQNTYSVTYDGNGNTGGAVPVDSSSPYLTGENVTVLGNTGGLTKTGCTFVEWNGSPGAVTGGSVFAMASANVVLYAVWNCPQYSVTYDGNGATGGSSPSTVNYSPGATVTVESNTGGLVRTGFAFNGWNTASDGSGTNYAGGNQFTIAANTTLYARWAPRYAVTYQGTAPTYSDGGALQLFSLYYDAGDTVTIAGNSGNLYKASSAFDRWNTAANGSGTDYVPAATFSMPASNLTLYPKWVAGGRIIYNGNGNTSGTAPTYTQHATGATVTVAGSSIGKTGEVLVGWNTASNGSGTRYLPGATFAMAGDITVYAHWVPTATTHYSVTYFANGGTGTIQPQILYYLAGDAPIVLEVTSITRSGFTFSGWTTASDGSGTVYTQGQTLPAIGANLILYAKWL